MQPADEVYPDPTDEIPLLSGLKNKISVLDPMSAQESLKKISRGSMDKETGEKAEKSLEILMKEYFKHKYLEKGGHREVFI